MSMTAFLGAIELGLCYALLAFGIYVTFRILYITDLSGDGSFVLGAAVSAMLTVAGHPLLGVAAGTLQGRWPAVSRLSCRPSWAFSPSWLVSSP